MLTLGADETVAVGAVLSPTLTVNEPIAADTPSPLVSCTEPDCTAMAYEPSFADVQVPLGASTAYTAVTDPSPFWFVETVDSTANGEPPPYGVTVILLELMVEVLIGALAL